VDPGQVTRHSGSRHMKLLEHPPYHPRIHHQLTPMQTLSTGKIRNNVFRDRVHSHFRRSDFPPVFQPSIFHYVMGINDIQTRSLTEVHYSVFAWLRNASCFALFVLLAVTKFNAAYFTAVAAAAEK